MNATHTAGPWTLQNLFVTSSLGIVICEVWDNVSALHDNTDEIDANARLIAASPELLEVLEGLLATAEAVDCSNKNQYGRDAAGFAPELFAKAHAVINKAKGA